MLATAGCFSALAELNFSALQTFFELAVGDPPLVIDASQFLTASSSCYIQPQITSIACATSECSTFATISGTTITLTAPGAAADHKQHTYEIFVTMQDSLGQQILPIRFGYRSFTTTTHLTPTHSVDSCKDAVYPLVFGDGAQFNEYKQFIVDDLGNILVLGYRYNAYRLHVSEAFISIDLSYYNQQGVPYWGTNVFGKTSGGA